MDLFLAELARAVPAGTHAALVLDGAGWHVSEDLTVPPNLTLIHPPPYSPELNPVERVWEYLRDRWLSHRVLAGGYEAVVDAACAAWNALLAEPGRLRSLTNFPWLPASVPLRKAGIRRWLWWGPQALRPCPRRSPEADRPLRAFAGCHPRLRPGTVATRRGGDDASP